MPIIGHCWKKRQKSDIVKTKERHVSMATKLLYSEKNEYEEVIMEIFFC